MGPGSQWDSLYKSRLKKKRWLHAWQCGSYWACSYPGCRWRGSADAELKVSAASAGLLPQCSNTAAGSSIKSLFRNLSQFDIFLYVRLKWWFLGHKGHLHISTNLSVHSSSLSLRNKENKDCEHVSHLLLFSHWCAAHCELTTVNDGSDEHQPGLEPAAFEYVAAAPVHHQSLWGAVIPHSYFGVSLWTFHIHLLYAFMLEHTCPVWDIISVKWCEM